MDLVVVEHQLREGSAVADLWRDGGHLGVVDADPLKASDVAQLAGDRPRERVLAELDDVGDGELAQPRGNGSREQVVAEVEHLKILQQGDTLRPDGFELVVRKDQTSEELEIGEGVWNSTAEAIARK